MDESQRIAVARQHIDAANRLLREGRPDQAEPHYRAALEATPDSADALHGFGVFYALTGHIPEAAQLLRRAHLAASDNLEIRSNLGQALLRIGQPGEALPHLLANSGHADAGLSRSIADALLRLGRFSEAVDWFQRTLAAQPGHPAALMGLGDALSVLGRLGEARRAFSAVLAANPNHAAAHYSLGVILQQEGQLDGARQAYARAIAISPNEPAFHRALAETHRFVEGDPRLPPLEALQREAVSARQTVELHFALGKAHDDLGRHARAFEHWSKANAARRALTPYDEAAQLEIFRDLETAFTPQVIAAGGGHTSALPIFVIGMPRSGTSLVEQILASHPDVFGAGELTVLNELVAQGAAGNAYPRTMPTPEMCRTLGRQYVERISPLARGAKRIVDKMPGNFLHAGLIRMALPGARIVHVHRDPVDTCFSCWTKLFPGGLDYTYDFGELARYYGAYERLMAHWRSVLPPGAIIEVCYETLVENIAPEAQRLVEACGLTWDARCLAFHKTRRAVRTLSQGQVRQPLFKTSIGRWRRYEQWLQPLTAALASGQKEGR